MDLGILAWVRVTSSNRLSSNTLMLTCSKVMKVIEKMAMVVVTVIIMSVFFQQYYCPPE